MSTHCGRRTAAYTAGHRILTSSHTPYRHAQTCAQLLQIQTKQPFRRSTNWSVSCRQEQRPMLTGELLQVAWCRLFVATAPSVTGKNVANQMPSREGQSCKQTDKQTDKQTNRQTNRQTTFSADSRFAELRRPKHGPRGVRTWRRDRSSDWNVSSETTFFAFAYGPSIQA